MKLRITTPDSNGHFTSGGAAALWLDNVDVSQYVSRVVVTVDAESVLQAEVTFALSEVECDIPAVIEPLLDEAREKAAVLGGNPVQHRSMPGD